jgi:hypothetical protein
MKRAKHTILVPKVQLAQETGYIFITFDELLSLVISSDSGPDKFSESLLYRISHSLDSVPFWFSA